MVINYSSSSNKIDKILSENESFDRAILKVAYTGENRNGSCITKKAFEKSIATIYNKPVVCNYNRETDEFGGHDCDVVVDKDGTPKLINLTQPVGIVPESASYWWEEIEDDSGVHEYLCTDVLLWKRQEAYEKIKSGKVTKESMEISVIDGNFVGDVYQINQFEFTAFCLLGVEPCFESAALHTFSYEDSYARMLEDFKATFGVTKKCVEGGTNLDRKKELLSSFNLTLEDISMNEEEFEQISYELLKNKLESFSEDNDDPENTDGSDSVGEGDSNSGSSKDEGKEKDDDENEEDDDDDDGSKKKSKDYTLTSQIMDALWDAIGEPTYTDECGTWRQYAFVDCDLELNEVYVVDRADDYKLYGFKFAIAGDVITIDWETKKRKKYVITDFDEGDVNEGFALKNFVNSIADDVHQAQKEMYEKKLEKLTTENEELSKFKKETLKCQREEGLNAIWEEFSELEANEDFCSLKENCDDMSVDAIRERCFAIAGKIAKATATFSKAKEVSKKQKIPKLKQDKDEPYGGLFIKYGLGQDE